MITRVSSSSRSLPVALSSLMSLIVLVCLLNAVLLAHSSISCIIFESKNSLALMSKAMALNISEANFW